MRLWLALVLCVALTSASVEQNVTRASDAVFLLDDFENLQNNVRGYRNGFAKAPSTSICRRVLHKDLQGHCLRIQAERSAEGFCGAWSHLHNFRDAEAEFVDASRWNFLTFRMRTESDLNDIHVRLADEAWIKKEDAPTIGPVSRWASEEPTDHWHEIVIPLSDARKVDLSRLGAVSFEFSTPGNHSVWIDDLCLKESPEARPPEPQQRLPFVADSHPKRAIWVWTTETIINDLLESDRLLSACQSEGISQLWIQLPYKLGTANSLDPISGAVSEFQNQQQASGSAIEIRNADKLRSFIQKAHRQSLEVHALDGSPEFSIRSGHAIPLAVIDAVSAFNAASRPDERFDGVHYDNEPYLLLGWSNPSQRETILHDLLTLNLECQRRAAAAGLKFGVDVPFWWNAHDAETGEASGAVTFEGSRKAATFHCIDHLDNVGIMNYRDQADGADGMLAHGLDILNYADNANRASIFMGVETFRYEPQPVWFSLGLPKTEFSAALQDRARHLTSLSRLHGLRLYRLQTAEHVHVGIEYPGKSATPEQIHLAQRAIEILAREFGHYSGGADDAGLLAVVRKEVERSPEWQGWSIKPIDDASAAVTFSGFMTTRLMPSKVTFADDSMSIFIEETNFAEKTFRRHSSYSGLAIHSWESFRSKLAISVEH